MIVNLADWKQIIENADMVLVGIGEDFEQKQFLQANEKYCSLCDRIAASHLEWAMPYVNRAFLKENTKLLEAYKALEELLTGKNYFVLTTCMDGLIRETGLKQERIVEPCGTYAKMQCIDGCENSITQTSTEFLAKLDACFIQSNAGAELTESFCEICGKPMVLNSLYAEKYDEAGYLADWEVYTKWLQGTLNRKLCILELGSGMMFANVLRFRFEKIAGLNQKSTLIRVHKNLYQLPEEVSKRGVGIAKDAMVFMAEMPEVW